MAEGSDLVWMDESGGDAKVDGLIGDPLLETKFLESTTITRTTIAITQGTSHPQQSW